jgi:phosphoribosylformylglycinamidine synthase
VIVLVKSLVLRVDGTNCAYETVIALELAGSNVQLAHINQLIRGMVDLEDYHALIIPGGFSFGDHIAAGKIIANYLKIRLKKDIKQFIEANKPVLGICNGFQALLKSGFLDIDATLLVNDSGLFIDTWVKLKKEADNIFTNGIETLFIPVNHGEGKFFAEKTIMRELEMQERIVLKYIDNPNGSYQNIAGIANEIGNVMGLMPHPEKFVHFYTHPYWTRLPREMRKNEGGGLKIFKNLVRACEKL